MPLKTITVKNRQVNKLLLNAYFLSDLAHIYDYENIRMTLFVPKGTVINFDKSTKYFLNDVDNIQNIYDRDMVKHYFKMTNKGLNCLDCEDENQGIKRKEIKKEVIQTEKIDSVKTINTSNDPEEIEKKSKAKIKR